MDQQVSWCWIIHSKLLTDWFCFELETSSDSSDTSDSDEENGDLIMSKKTKKAVHPPKNPYRSSDTLEQYRRHLDLSSNRCENDELASILRDVKEQWTRCEVYEFFARKTRSIHGLQLIACPDYLNASSNLLNEFFFVKDREVCR